MGDGCQNPYKGEIGGLESCCVAGRFYCFGSEDGRSTRDGCFEVAKACRTGGMESNAREGVVKDSYSDYLIIDV